MAAVAVVASASRAGLERRGSSGEGRNGGADDPTAAHAARAATGHRWLKQSRRWRRKRAGRVSGSGGDSAAAAKAIE